MNVRYDGNAQKSGYKSCKIGMNEIRCEIMEYRFYMMLVRLYKN